MRSTTRQKRHRRARRWVAASAVTAALAGGLWITAPAPAAFASASNSCTPATRIGERPPALSMMQSDLAWQITRGAGVTVAVVDSGVLALNPHLAPAFAGGINLVGDGAAADGSTDSYGHGTAIAGQIAARALDGSAVEGLAPEAQILSVRVFAGVDQQQLEAGVGPQTGRLAEGIRWAADAGAQIINVSMSTTVDSPEIAGAVAYATSRGSLVIGSAGNRNNVLSIEESEADVARYPAGNPGVLGVAATDLSGVVTEDSIHGSHVAVSALGQQIVTASALGGDCVYAGDAPATSYAAGYVSAAAALVAAAHPDETPAQWAYRLTATAVRPDPDARNDSAGWGAVQPYDAIVLVPGAGLRGPKSPFVEAGSETSGDAATPEPLRVLDEPPADAAAVAFGTTAAVGALIALGGAGALGVFVARRRAAASAVGTTRRGGGLYRDD